MISLCIYGVWSMLPFTIILLLAGLQNIDPQYYTAAKVDGAKTLDIFFNITVPLLAPTIGLVAIVNMISSFKVFDALYMLFGGKPGPAYNLYTVIFYLYEQFYTKLKLGYAAASAIVLFAIILLFTMVQNRIQKNMIIIRRENDNEKYRKEIKDYTLSYSRIGAFIMFFSLSLDDYYFLKTGFEANKVPPTIFPAKATLDNYVYALKTAPFLKYFKNSRIVTIFCVTITMFNTILAAFAFSKMRFPGRDIIFCCFGGYG